MKRRWTGVLVGLLAIGFGAAALFHLAALFAPSLAGTSAPWRHGLFVAINALVAAGLYWRPRWFVVVFALLTLQQLYSHGRSLMVAWQDGRHDWASVLVLIAMPCILGILAREATGQKR